LVAESPDADFPIFCLIEFRPVISIQFFHTSQISGRPRGNDVRT
jgi:hypothetical protein